MASWQGNYDNSANAPYWAAFAGHLRANNTNSGTLVYQNTSNTAFYRPQKETVGLYGIDDNEKIVEGNSGSHAGWILRTVGEGGRAGRVQEETLMVISKFKTDSSGDDAIYQDASITITTQPSRGLLYANTANANSVSLSVVTTTSPPGTTTTYVWQYNNASGSIGWTRVLDSAGTQLANLTFSGNTTNTLVVTPSANTTNNYVFRVTATGTPPGGIVGANTATETSSNAAVVIL